MPKKRATPRPSASRTSGKGSGTKAPTAAARGLSTLGISGGWEPHGAGAPVAMPLILSSTFIGGREGEPLLYTRYGNNPTQQQLERKLAALEGTEAAIALSSGMAAIAMTSMALLEKGDHIVASRDLYGATVDFFANELPRRGITCTFVDPEREGAWRKALRTRTRMLYLELPTNPTLRVPDPRPAAEVARERGIPLVADATFASPVNLRARELGIDLVIHSASKYLGGHSDLIGGVVAGSAAHIEAIAGMMRRYGPSADPHMAWLMDRGLRTLAVRMERHNTNSLAVARFLEGRREVQRVLHPGLESHPDHARACEIMPNGTGGMVSFVVRGGAAAADRFMHALELIQPAPSLGGVESLVSQPRFTSHKSLSAAQRRDAGIPDGFLRLSVGIEDVDDLLAELDRALVAAVPPRARASRRRS